MKCNSFFNDNLLNEGKYFLGEFIYIAILLVLDGAKPAQKTYLMVITDDLIYFELHKTGCSHTVKILSDLYAGQHQIVGKHNTYDQVSKKVIGNFQKKIKVGNIRNPWDWYVSLWSFGCQKEGGLYQKLAGAGPSVFSKSGVKKFLLKTIH